VCNPQILDPSSSLEDVGSAAPLVSADMSDTFERLANGIPLSQSHASAVSNSLRALPYEAANMSNTLFRFVRERGFFLLSDEVRVMHID